ncbi:MATE family efflux transporter [Persicimonas caeni]|uniref:Multidrug-efflux transporter n=1 Tax=Persicimonas caeni TaxID=2292766 RepID=A0A4Y6PLY2_PERCE|nr:MATE family efflux transporter [Persicimonas caeni]QDG49260.1 MATE family efflux transporter [Persicimonas caeni]QED30481.1 MATE family efflux transporter [Persicimonas caeni]
MSALAIDLQRSKRIVWLAAPIVIAMLTQTGINVVDTIFVGKLDASYSIPGQAALGFSLPIFWTIGGFLAAIGVGTQAMTARRFGAGQHKRAGTVLANGIILSVVSSLVLTAVGWYAIPYFFRFLTSNEAVLALGIPYAQVRVLGVTGMVATTAYKGFFDGMGRTRVHMYACIVMNACNIVLNYSLIFGIGPIPAMHVTGAAIASVISTFIGLAIMVGWTFRDEFRSKFAFYRPSNFKPSVMWSMAKLSFPSGAAQIFVMAGVLMFLKIIALLDEEAVLNSLGNAEFYGAELTRGAPALHSAITHVREFAGRAFTVDWANTLMWSRPPVYTTAAKLIIDLLSIGFVTCIAFGQATATLVSQSMGEKNYAEAEAFGWDSVKLGMYFFGFVGLLVILFPEAFLDVLSDDEIVIQAAVPGLRIMASLEMFIAMALILTQALFGAGNTKFVMVAELILHGVCLVPLAYLFAVVFDWGFLGVWMSATVYVVALGMVMAWKFWEGSWKEIEV